MKTRILQIIILFYSIGATAQTSIENFSYGTPTGTSADTITNPSFGGSVWRRHSGTTGQVKYLGTSLSYAGYASSGVGGSANFTFATGFSQDINRPTIAFNSGSVYTSFLLNMAASGGVGSNDSYFFNVMDTLAMTSFRCRVYIKDGTVANTFKVGLTKGSNTGITYTTTDYPLNSTVLVVLKYKFDPVNSDSAFAYVFTSGIPATEPNVANLIAIDISTGDLVTFNAFAIRQHPTGSTMTGTIDGIRVSNTWGNGVLPVKFLDLNASINDKSTLISWSTSSENNNKGFEIERSTNGVDFEKIGFVKGIGNSNKINSYFFNYINTESTFYRLKQIDFDGQFEYSNTIATKNKKIESEILPNPFKDEITIINENTITKTEIIDITGKVVLTVEQNSNKATINTAGLNNGIYYLKIYKIMKYKLKK
jgi:hypothetical protein